MEQQAAHEHISARSNHGATLADDQPAAQNVSARRQQFKAAYALIEDLTINAGRVQQRLLSEILAQNSCTEYLRKLAETAHTEGGLVNAHSVPAVMAPQTFKRVAPLVTYEDLQPSIQRIANGDKSPIFTAHPVTKLFKSSGTCSGVNKLFPAIESDSERIQLFLHFSAAVVHQYVEGLDNGKEAAFTFVWSRQEERTAGGLPKHSVIKSIFRSPWMQQHIKDKHTSPIEVMDGCSDMFQCTYCQIVCLLVQRQEVVQVDSSFAGAMLRVIHILQERWQELVKDINSGSLSESVDVAPTLRRAVETLMDGPNAALAKLVEEECSREPRWQGIIRRLWPNAKCVACIVSGSMKQYIPLLEFFSGGLPLISRRYAASECMIGINMSPLCSPYEVSYTLIPNMAYFEFLPLDADAAGDDAPIDQSLLVDLVNVKLGTEYELVVTTFSGLYRYRVGDILQVTGFHNEAPRFRMVGRKNVVLSVDIDKTDELTLQRAVEVARSSHLEAAGNCQLVDYTSYTDVSSVPGHYVLFWEVTWGEGIGAMGTIPLDAAVFEACCAVIEECFDIMYKLGRAGCIGPLEIRVVMPGSFRALVESNVERGACIMQYKMPRCLKLAPMVELLNSRVLHSFFSPKCPVLEQ